MNGVKKSKVLVAMASLSLSLGLWASSPMNLVTDPVTGVVETTTKIVTWPLMGWHMNSMHGPDYKVTDMHHGQVKFLDGIDKGHKVSDDGDMKYGHCYLKGDKITNLHTQKSGIIKGVKDQGTMDVMTPNGHTVRYQYVTFKVKPL
ncbi:MAG: hypothetical protein ACOYKA_04895 [Legionellaceae bacterium]